MDRPRTGGPEIALPDDEAAAPAPTVAPVAGRITVAASYRKLLEVTHFHLFSMPVYLLVFGHLFLLTGATARIKTAWISASVAATAVHLCAPWLVFFGGRSVAWIYPISGAALLASFAVLMGLPLVEMWRPGVARSTATNPHSRLTT